MSEYKMVRCPRCTYVRNPVDRGSPDTCVQCGFQLISPEAKKQSDLEYQSRLDEIDRVRATGTVTLQRLFGFYVGSEIGINVADPSKVERAQLVEVHADHFVVAIDGLEHFLPYAQVIRVSAPPTRATRERRSGERFALSVRMFDFVIYKGAIGVGMSVPLG